MKKTWKERFYDFCTSYTTHLCNGLLLVAIGMFAIICLFLKENDVLTYSPFFLMMVAVFWTHFSEAITHYNKDTILYNKLSVILFAKFEFVVIMSTPIFAGIFLVVRLWLLPDVLSNFWHVLIAILTLVFLGIGIFIISRKISECCQKKIVHTGKDENDREKAFKELLTKVIKFGVSDFYRPKIDPGFDKQGNICYQAGLRPAVGKSYNWWAKSAKEFCPERNSR